MKQPKLSGEPTDEFILRVNDFIQMANRIERRFDTAHAQMAFLHAFSRYGAHHYFSTVKADSPAERDAYATHIGDAVRELVRQNLEHLREPSAGADEPAAE